MNSAWKTLLSFVTNPSRAGEKTIKPGYSNTTKQKIIGDKAEQVAEQHLHQLGLTTVAKNYRCKSGEIDIIMEDKGSLVFVEVRSRKTNDYGTALESVSTFKQQRLIKTAQHYLQTKKLSDKKACRFDVISVPNHSHSSSSNIEWIPNAFGAG